MGVYIFVSADMLTFIYRIEDCIIEVTGKTTIIQCCIAFIKICELKVVGKELVRMLCTNVLKLCYMTVCILKLCYSTVCILKLLQYSAY